jgi:hypothetical protein
LQATANAALGKSLPEKMVEGWNGRDDDSYVSLNAGPYPYRHRAPGYVVCRVISAEDLDEAENTTDTQAADVSKDPICVFQTLTRTRLRR